MRIHVPIWRLVLSACAFVLVGVSIGYGIRWLEDRNVKPIYQVGDYDVVVYPTSLDCDDDPHDVAFQNRAGFGVAWPIEESTPEMKGPQMLAIIDSQDLKLVDYDELSPALKEFVQEPYLRRDWPRMGIIPEGGEDPPPPDDVR